MKKVLFAEVDATVWTKIGDAETLPDGSIYEPYNAKVLPAGEYISLDETPKQYQELVKEGKAKGVTLLDEKELAGIKEKMDLIRGLSPVIGESDKVVETVVKSL